MKKINLLPLLFSLSLSVAWGAQTQEDNEQDKAKENIESKNNKEPSIPSLKRDIRQHWGYYIILTICGILSTQDIFFFMYDGKGIPTKFNITFLILCLAWTLICFISIIYPAIGMAFAEDIGKVDDNPNLLSYKNRLLRILKFVLPPLTLRGWISFCAMVYHFKKGDLPFTVKANKTAIREEEPILNCIILYYPLIVQAVCVIYLLITPTIENAQTQEDKATVNETNYVA